MPRSGARRGAIRGRVTTGLKRLPLHVLHVLPSYHRAGCCRAGSALRHRVNVPSHRHLGGRRVSCLYVRLAVCLVVRRVACLVRSSRRLSCRSARGSSCRCLVTRPVGRLRRTPCGASCRSASWPRCLARLLTSVPYSPYRSAAMRRWLAAAGLPRRRSFVLPASRTANPGPSASRRMAALPYRRPAVTPCCRVALLPDRRAVPLYGCTALRLCGSAALRLYCSTAVSLTALVLYRSADPSARRRRVRLPVRAVPLRTHDAHGPQGQAIARARV